MIFAAITWIIGAAIYVAMLRWVIRRGYPAATGMLIVMGPLVYAHPLLFVLGLHYPIPPELFDGPEWHLVVTALLISIAWMLLIFATHALFLRAFGPLGRLIPKVDEGLNTRWLIIAAVITTILGALLTSLLVLKAGSVRNLMYAVKVEKALAGSYLIREISVVAAVFSMVFVIHFEKLRREAPRRVRHGKLVAFGLALFVVNLAFNYFWGNRDNIAMLLVAFALGWHWYIKKLHLVRVLVLVLIAATALQSLKVLRSHSVDEILDRTDDSAKPFWDDVSASLHLNQFDAFMLALRDAGTRFDFRDGKDFKNGLLAWVPRKYFPEKETFHVGGWFRRIYQPNVINGWPITTMGDWYVNFGKLGIVFGGMISGIFAAMFDAGYKGVRKSAWQAATGPAIALLIFDLGVDPGLVQRFVLDMVPICLLALGLNMVKRDRDQSHVHRPPANFVTN